MTYHTKYIQTSNLKLNFENWEALSFSFESNFSKESAIVHITENKNQSLISSKQSAFFSEKGSSGYRMNNVL